MNANITAPVKLTIQEEDNQFFIHSSDYGFINRWYEPTDDGLFTLAEARATLAYLKGVLSMVQVSGMNDQPLRSEAA